MRFWRLSALLTAAILPGRSSLALPADIARLAEEGSAQLYNLEFDRAFATFNRLAAAHPEHPAGYGLLASARWWEARYAFTKPDARSNALVTKELDTAIKLARAMAARPGEWCEGEFFLGGALGIRAHWELVQHNWVAAAIGARRSVTVLGPMVTCTPYGDEAMFGLGLYEYAAARLPWSLRWLSRYITGVGADSSGGLAKLEHAAVQAHWVRTDAQATLVNAYTYYDRDAVRALRFAGMFRHEHPDSPMAHTLYAQSLAISGRFAETLEAVDTSLARGREPGSTFALETTAYDYWRGIALLGLGRPADAVDAFTRAIGAAGRAPWITSALLKRGCAHDLLGQRALAVADYRAMLRRPDPWEEARLARTHLKTPFTWKDFDHEIAPHRGKSR